MTAVKRWKDIAPPPYHAFSRWAVAFLVAAWALFLAIRMTAPPHLMDDDQERPAAYVLDCLDNGRWASQRDQTGDVMSKPPLYTWLAAATMVVTGRNLWGLYIPTALAVLAVCLAVFFVGRRFFGERTAFWAALTYLLTATTFKQLALARTDPLFTCTIVLGAFTAFHAWRHNPRYWSLFWIIAAFSTLTKGPLGLLFMAMGLLACFWERGEKRSPFPWMPQALGVLLFFAITGLWFLAAWATDGQDLINKILLKELVGHAVASQDKTPWWSFITPPLYYLARFAPWSFVALPAFARVLRKPSEDKHTRAFERFLFCWFAGGLSVLMLASHKRADLLFPLYPVAALFAGRQIARLPGPRKWGEGRTALAVVLAGAALLGAYAFIIRGQDIKIQKTVAARQMARDLKAGFGDAPELTFLDAPYALQFFMGIFRPNPTLEEVAALLAGEEPAYVVVKKDKRIKEMHLPPEKRQVLGEWPDAKNHWWRLYANCPTLNAPGGRAFFLYRATVRLRHARLVKASRYTWTFEATGPEGAVAIRVNGRPLSRPVRVRLLRLNGETEISWIKEPLEDMEIVW